MTLPAALPTDLDAAAAVLGEEAVNALYAVLYDTYGQGDRDRTLRIIRVTMATLAPHVDAALDARRDESQRIATRLDKQQHQPLLGSWRDEGCAATAFRVAAEIARR